MQQHQQLDFATATMKRPKPVPYKRFKLISPDKSVDDLEKETESEDAAETSMKEEEPGNTTDESLVVKKKTKLISVGSPVPDSYIRSKPPLENWSENNTLAELIYFENLPNYTGVFDKMTSVLRGVRNRLFNKPSSSTATETTDETNNNSEQTTDPSQSSTEDSDVQILS